MNDKAKTAGAEILEQAVQNYEQAFKAGVKLQEECGKCFTSFLKQATAPQDWQKASANALKETFPLAQKNIEETLQLIEQNSQAGLDLLKKTAETFQAGSVAEGQAGVQKLWQASLDILQKNAQAMTQSSARLVDACAQYARKASPAAAAAK